MIMTKVITNDSTVTMHFAIKLADGSTAENTRLYKKPAHFKIGDGSLTDTFEALLIGLKVGDKKQFTIEPEAGFGMPSPQNIHVLSRSQFPEDIKLEEGLIIAFQQPNNVELPGIIRKFDEQQVTVDFNHPLCGQTLTFDVEILEIE